MTPLPAAYTLATQLDEMLAAAPDDDEDLMTRIAEPLGGLSSDGFRFALNARLTAIREAIMDEATWPDYSPGRGGNDPDHWVSAELQDRVYRAQEDACRAWVKAAQGLMRPAMAMQVAA